MCVVEAILDRFAMHAVASLSPAGATASTPRRAAPSAPCRPELDHEAAAEPGRSGRLSGFEDEIVEIHPIQSPPQP
jgi:hypothetical protein